MITYLLAALAVAATSAPTSTPASQPAAVPVAAVWDDPGYAPPPFERRLHVGVWADGTVIWSTGAKEPYQKAKVELARVEKLLKDLDELKFFDDPQVNHNPNQYPPDASHTTIAAHYGDKRQRISTWRNPPETGPARFKEVFVEAEKLIRGIVPDKGEPCDKPDGSVYQLGRQPRGSSVGGAGGAGGKSGN